MRDVRRDHIEDALMVTNGGSENAARTGHVCQRELTCSCQTMANLSPVDQITAVKDGNAWKILKAAGHQIVILPDTADTGIGVETWNHWIRIGNHSFHSYHLHLSYYCQTIVSPGRDIKKRVIVAIDDLVSSSSSSHQRMRAKPMFQKPCARAMRPSQRALGLTARSCVRRSTAMRPKVGR